MGSILPVAESGIIPFDDAELSQAAIKDRTIQVITQSNRNGLVQFVQ
jgi:hypothetical protein